MAVLARGHRGVSASERIDRIISIWEKRLGTLLQRPAVLEGDLRFEGLQLSNADSDWFRHNVTSIVHNAASVRFQESHAGEPMKSNVEGTRNLLDLCRNSRVSEFHYVSSAYACGQVNRSAPVLEKLHNSTGPFGNIYEQSKCLSEHLVAASDGDFSRTIYRPSIIVGESTSGFAPSFNAIYTPLRLASIVLIESPSLVRTAEDLLDPIGVEGTEARNIVPVDWVCQAITSIMRDSSNHGRIYHLTNPVETDGQTIITAMIQALAANSHRQPRSPSSSQGPAGKMDLDAFRQHMQTYSSYFQSDPPFDNSQYRGLPASVPCPVMSLEMLTRIFDFAIKAQFQDVEVIAEVPPSNEPRHSLETLMKANGRESNRPHSLEKGVTSAKSVQDNGANHFGKNGFQLKLSGSGGGWWWIESSPQAISCSRPTIEHWQSLQVYGSTAAFRSWLMGEFSFEDGLRSGSFVVTGDAREQAGVAERMRQFRSNVRSAFDRNHDRFDTEQGLVTHTVFAPEGNR